MVDGHAADINDNRAAMGSGAVPGASLSSNAPAATAVASVLDQQAQGPAVTPTADSGSGSAMGAAANDPPLSINQGGEAEPFAARVIINHGRERRLELTLVQGDITQIDASCYVVGLFKAVAPGGAAAALDRAMQGRISDLIARRMFGAEVGEISILPNGRRSVRAPNVAFAGLGSFDSFQPATLKLVCDNLVRTFVAAGLDDFAMVPFGWGSTSDDDQRAMVRAMLEGFLRAIKDSDHDRRFRELTICEVNPDRFALINDEIHDLGQRESFSDLELTIEVVHLPQPTAELGSAAAITTARIYLMAREIPQQGPAGAGRAPLLMSVLTSGDKAAILTDQQPASPNALDKLLCDLEDYSSYSDTKADEFGDNLAKALLTDGVATALIKHSECHVVVVHDAAASRIPWETLRIGGNFPALTGGLSHRYEASDLSVAKWLQCRQQAETLSVLLVANPTGDLPGAAVEGQRISDFLKPLGKVALEELWNDAATKDAVAKAFASGRFDVVHYAGHAFFDPQQRGRSGVFCANHEVLSGQDLATIDNLPTLMFFNACEAARVRGADAVVTPAGTVAQKVQGGIGFAEALLRGGIANFIGTYWPVGDEAASAFAKSFYPALLRGMTLNDALLESRCSVKKLAASSPQDWADYVFYGDPDFRLKLFADDTNLPGDGDGQ